VILGATGTGKSELAYRLALRLKGQVVNCDALQVYRGFDAATAKPDLDHRSRIPHHLVDCIDPRDEFSVAEFVRHADDAIATIDRAGEVPIVAGGTGLYLRGLLRGIVPGPARDERLRGRIHAMARRHGNAALHRWLRRIDPASAARLAVGDRQRVARAIEFTLLSGQSWSERLEAEGTWGRPWRERYESLKIGLELERPLHYERLDRRVEGFFRCGLVDEVRGLLRQGVPAGVNAMKGIGYREVAGAIGRGQPPESTIEQVKRSTRRLAKRQRTWFRREPNVIWLDVGAGLDRCEDRALDLWHRVSDGAEDSASRPT
jgi:tRNA dimethylallyltransferase